MKVVLGKKYYSAFETAELLGVTTASVHNYAKSGALKFSKIGGRRFFTEESLRKFITES